MKLIKLLLSWCFLCFSVQCAELRAGNSQREVLLNRCKGCGLLRNRMRKINADNSCVDACRLFLNSRRPLSGWECGTCEERKGSTKQSNAPSSLPSSTPSKEPSSSPSKEPSSSSSSSPSSSPTPEPAYVVTLDVENVQSGSLKSIIRNEAAKWNKVIIGDVPDIAFPDSFKDTSTYCAARAIPDVIDDILICVNVLPIDGANGIVGQASVEYSRTESNIPLLGGMVFDTADVDDLLQQGLFDEVILHEMGHVFGINGVIWELDGLINSLEPPCSYKLDSAASREWQIMSGCVGTSVPIENGGGGGTECSHFDEFALTDELMTGFVDNDPPIMSRLTVATLQDIGYEVDYNAAKPFNGVVGSCTRRLQTDEEKLEETADSGLENAIQYGKNFLKQQAEQVIAAGQGVASNVKYIGDQSVSIVYINDAGKVRHVSVNNV